MEEVYVWYVTDTDHQIVLALQVLQERLDIDHFVSTNIKRGVMDIFINNYPQREFKF